MRRLRYGVFLLAMMAVLSAALSGCGSTGGTSTSALDESSDSKPMASVTGSSWAKTYIGVQIPSSWNRALLGTNDGGYLATGYFEGSAAILKLGGDGSIVWQNAYTGMFGTSPGGVAVTPDGGYVLGGLIGNGAPGGYDVLALKVNGDGTIAWQRTYADPGGSKGATDIRATSDGGYIILAKFAMGDGVSLLKLNGDGTIAWQKDFYTSGNCSPCRIQPTADNGYIVDGAIRLPTSPYYDMFVMKVDAIGSPVWGNQYSYSGSGTFGRGLQQTADGGYIVSEWGEAILVKLSPGGAVSWANRYTVNDSEHTHLRDIVQTPDNKYTAVGYFFDQATGVNLRWMGRLNSHGGIAWQRSYGMAGYRVDGSTVQLMADGGYVTAGTTYLGTSGLYGLTVVKTRSDGTCTPLDNATTATVAAVNFVVTPLDLTVSDAIYDVSDANLTAVATDIVVTQQAP